MNIDDRRLATFNLSKLTEWLWRGILLWVVVTVIQNRSDLIGIEASRFSARDGYELVQAQSSINSELSEAIIRLQEQTRSIKQRLNLIEAGG